MKWYEAVLVGGAIVGIYSIMTKSEVPTVRASAVSDNPPPHGYLKPAPTFAELTALDASLFSHG